MKTEHLYLFLFAAVLFLLYRRSTPQLSSGELNARLGRAITSKHRDIEKLNSIAELINAGSNAFGALTPVFNGFGSFFTSRGGPSTGVPPGMGKPPAP